MKDRLNFKTTKLKNGITVYSKKTDDPFVIISIYIPLGHIHNTGNILPGTAHFLEHVVTDRSRLYPKRKQFEQRIEFNGGYFNAETNIIRTGYFLNVSSEMFEEGFKGLLSHVFEPIITPQDIKHERGIILNESKMQNKWYPGDDELSHHIQTKWRNLKITSYRQRIGNSSDLKKMTVKKLRDFHKNYFNEDVFVIIGGSFSEKIIFNELSKIRTKKVSLPRNFEQFTWINREYHEKKFGDINRPVYRIGGIFPERDFMTETGINFIGSLLTNSTHGVLMKWLREDLGWSYNFDFSTDSSPNPYIHNTWELCIPLNNKKQVDIVRRQLHKRIIKAISDKKLVAKEVQRRKAARIFWFPSISSILSFADEMIGVGGEIHTEKEFLRACDKCSDIAFLKQVYDKHFSPKVIGEFLAIPK